MAASFAPWIRDIQAATLETTAGTPSSRKISGNSGKSGPKSASLTECTERLRSIVQKSGGTKQVAARAGVALSTLGSYLAGGEMKLSTAMQLCEACNVSLAWLVGDEAGPNGNGSAAAHDGYVPIRRLRTGDVASGPTAALLEHVLFSAGWLRTQLDRDPSDLLALEVRGTAMEPTVHQGDLLLVDTRAAAIVSCEIHVIELQGELLVRRLERVADGGIIVTTDNQRFPPRVIDKSERERIKLLGRVVWKGSRASF